MGASSGSKRWNKMHQDAYGLTARAALYYCTCYRSITFQLLSILHSNSFIYPRFQLLSIQDSNSYLSKVILNDAPCLTVRALHRLSTSHLLTFILIVDAQSLVCFFFLELTVRMMTIVMHGVFFNC